MISMTYAEVDQALYSSEGLLNVRIVQDNQSLDVQEFIDNEWQLSDARSYRVDLRRIALRESYKILKKKQVFDPECEFMAKRKFQTSASSEYQREWVTNKRKEKREQILNLKKQTQIPQMKHDIIEMTGDKETRTKTSSISR